jgi:hypothetical protein
MPGRWGSDPEALQEQLRSVHEQALKQEQKNRHLRLEIERQGTVLERRTRERDLAFEELARYASTPKYARVLQAARGPLEKKVRNVEAVARSKRREHRELAALVRATTLAEADAAAEEYGLELRRLQPLLNQISAIEAAMRDAKRDAARRARRGQDADDAEASIEMYRLELTELRRRVEGDDDF